MKNIVIIGGGASGLVAGIFSKSANNSVTIIEKNNVCGKKILATGNGRCNYWNDDQSLSHYRSTSNSNGISKVLNEGNKESILEFFKNIGIIPKIKNGYYYPFSNQAISMQKALILEAKKKSVILKNNFDVQKVQKENDRFTITSKDNEKIYADKVIIATGSKAAPKTGSDGIGYEICQKFGHKIINPLPALVQLKSSESFLKEWDGIRADVNIKLFENGSLAKSEDGEIQLTNYGISGICVFNLSGIVSRGLEKGKKEEVKINFLYGLNLLTRNDFIKWMCQRNEIIKNRNIHELLEGILNNKLIDVILKKSQIKNEDKWNKMSEKQKDVLAQNLIEFNLKINGTNSFDKAQVCTGGIALDEINLSTMESNLIKNLYIVGELLDVDGDCGGYNLEWAWVTGMIAGKSIAI